ncbi:MAG: LysR family transcriptional regulator [Pseudomonadota bacterium]
MDELKPIRVFLEVARNLSFAKAARVLRMTPASVTRIVARLEEETGQQLLVRTTRQVSLTSAGAVAVDRYTPLIAEFDRVRDDIARAARPDLGRLRLNAPLSMGLRLLPQMVDSLRLAYPRIDLDVHLTDAFVDVIEEDCDLAIRVSGPPTDKSTIWRKLCEVPRSVLAAPQLLSRFPTVSDPGDLRGLPLMSYSATGEAESWVLTQGAERRVLRAGTNIVSNNGDFLLELARGGHGVCVLPDFIARDALKAGDLVRVVSDWALPPLWLTLYYPPYEKLPPLVATFSEFFEAFIRDMDDMVF